jgi:predicted RNA binding protein YcfA (HicA-like mRNA interferase family)
VLDLVREQRPPFSPEATVHEFAATIRRYGLSTARSDPGGPDSPSGPARKLDNLALGYPSRVKWSEVLRKLKQAGYVELRKGKGSHLHLVHRATGKRIMIAVHTSKDAGRLGDRILRDAGVEQ